MAATPKRRFIEKSQWNNPRRLVERIQVRGELVLETPTHFGNGDDNGPLDMPLIRDELLGLALLTGTTLTGGLRAYLAEQDETLANRLFGTVEKNESRESCLVIEDALGIPPGVEIKEFDDISEIDAARYSPQVELRDGVAIDLNTRTAEDEKKFDIELLAAGTRFPLVLELSVMDGQSGLVEGLARALQGLEQGSLHLGKRKRRGFGRCRVEKWQVCRYPMDPAGLARWLEEDRSQEQSGARVDRLLLGRELPIVPRPEQCSLDAVFKIDGSLLIRSAVTRSPAPKDKSQPRLPDQVHLRSQRGTEFRPVLSGTSLAGALRAQTIRIANTMGRNGAEVAEKLFGRRTNSKKNDEEFKASRVWVEESEIEKPLDLAQSRVKIDRFTGGAYPGALFTEQPVFSQDGTKVEIHLKVDGANDEDAGLLLLLLKDLWTGHLTLGGERSIGRGRLKGESAVFAYDGLTWTISAAEDGIIDVTGGRPEQLQKFVDAFTGRQPDEND